MHIKFLNTGTGDARHAVNYVLGERDHKGELRAQVRLLEGDPEQFVDISNSLDFAYRYSSAVISWHRDDDPSDEQIKEVVDEFKKAAFAGLDESRFSYMAVMHADDDGSKHVHFLVSRVDLVSGKSFNPAPPGWQKLYDPLRDYFNYRNGWARPDDPERQRAWQPGHEAYELNLGNPKTAKQEIISWLMTLAQLGFVSSRQDVLDNLKGLGEITRKGKDYISIKPKGFKKAIRLKGALFREDLNPSIINSLVKSEAVTQKPDPEMAEKARKKLNEALNRRAKFNSEHYPSIPETDPPHTETTFSADTQSFPTLQKPHIYTAFFKGRSLGVIIDRGNEVVAQDFKSSRAAAFHVVNAGIDKGWKTIRFTGNDAFVREAMRLALKRGLEVVAKDKHQVKMLEKVKEEMFIHDRVREAFDTTIKESEREARKLDRACDALIEVSNEFNKAYSVFDRRVREIKNSGGLKMAYDSELELERFKAEIPIQQYLQDHGWTIDRKKSSKRHAVLSDSYGRKVVVSRNENNHYVFFDVETGKGGSIVDLVQDLTGKNLGQVRKELRGYIGGEIERHSSSPSPIHLEKSSKDEQAVQLLAERWTTLNPLDQRYLNSRGIAHIDGRFSNIKTDSYGNTCFPHYKSGRVVGWEKKNRGFTGFEKGSLRSESVYASMNLRDASQIIIVESGIDALSHAQLFQTDSSVAYVSIGGQLTDKQVELIKEITLGKHVIVAVDNDEAGEQYASKLTSKLINITNCDRQTPINKDWNDDLLEQIEERKRERAATRSYDGFELGM